jgi:hypothetical protein
MPPVLFALVIFEVGFHFLLWTSSPPVLCMPVYRRMAGRCHHVQFFPHEMGGRVSLTYLPGLAWNHNSLNLSLLYSWNHRCVQLLVELGFEELSFCPAWPRTTILLILVCNVARITGLSHCAKYF